MSATMGAWECRHGVDGRDHCPECQGGTTEEEVRTLEARRQLIWAAKQQGWLEAAEYLEEHGRDNAAQILRIKLKEEILDPSPR